MKIYIASPFELMPAVRTLHSLIEMDKQMKVISSWHQMEHPKEPTHEYKEKMAILDLMDIECADTLLLINPPNWIDVGTGGRHVEVGYAIAKRIPIVILGARKSAMHFHPMIKSVVPDIHSKDPELLSELRRISTCLRFTHA